jgi:hypothetical protein
LLCFDVLPESLQFGLVLILGVLVLLLFAAIVTSVVEQTSVITYSLVLLDQIGFQVFGTGNR